MTDTVRLVGGIVSTLFILLYFFIAAKYPRPECMHWFTYWVFGGEGCGNPFKTPSWYLMCYVSTWVVAGIVSGARG